MHDLTAGMYAMQVMVSSATTDIAIFRRS